VRPPTTGPPNKAAIKVVTWERSRAREMLIGPRKMEGRIGEIVIERNDNTFPSALINAMNVKFFEDLALKLIFDTTIHA
jgi:hypothetical protein